MIGQREKKSSMNPTESKKAEIQKVKIVLITTIMRPTTNKQAIQMEQISRQAKKCC